MRRPSSFIQFLPFLLILALSCTITMGSLVLTERGARALKGKVVNPPRKSDKNELREWMQREGLLLSFDLIDFAQADLEIVDKFHPSFFTEYAEKGQLEDIARIYARSENLGIEQTRRYNFIKEVLSSLEASSRGKALWESQDIEPTDVPVTPQEDSENPQQKRPSSRAIAIPDSPLHRSREIKYSSSSSSSSNDQAETPGGAEESHLPEMRPAEKADSTYEFWEDETLDSGTQLQ